MTVLLLTIIYTFIPTVYSQPKDAICIWGRTTIPGPEANGLYRLGTEQANDAPYWKLDMTGTDCPNKYFWLFWYGDNIDDQGWYIGTSGTQDFAFGIDGLLHAKCTNAAAIQTLDPTHCGANWAYFDPFDTIDSGVTASEGPCPTLNCASITVTGIGYSGGCSGTFDQTGNQSNHYTQSGSDKIWWFNVPRFQWHCNTGITNAEQTCDNTRLNTDIVQYVAAQTWQGETGTMTYTGVVCACGTGSMSIQCITGGGASTTTYLPTTPNPTQVLTPKPTKVTLVPTINPTATTDTPTAPSAPTAPTMPTGAPSAPTEPTTQAPNTADTVYDPDDKDDNGSGGSMIDGLDDTWLWVIIIILIIILCCCCICCLWFYRKRQKENSNQYFGDNDTGNYQDDQNL